MSAANTTRGASGGFDLWSGLGRLEAELRSGGGRGAAPVERWNPPYCGDIGLAIGRDGTWFYRGSAIGRMPMVKLFASVLRRDDDGRHYLVTPVEKVDVSVEDAPFVAVEMEVLAQGRDQTIVVRTNVDDVVRIGDAHPMRFVCDEAGGFKPYVRVRGRLDALFSRSLAYDLAQLFSADATGRAGIWSGGTFYELDGPELA
ncbi:MAG: DUF1285 domain-containing protein [Hyphomicrobiaceae bacterium]|nr:DUF1285 domain-containing protein [Hyphomicrobiaceae bacterium]